MDHSLSNSHNTTQGYHYRNNDYHKPSNKCWVTNKHRTLCRNAELSEYQPTTSESQKHLVLTQIIARFFS